MPRVALTEAQRIEYECEDLCREIMEKVLYRKAARGLSDEEIAAEISGISASMISTWRKGHLMRTRFDVVLRAVRFAGYELRLEKRTAPKAPRQRAISATRDDTYGTIIEGLIRKIVEETIDRDVYGK